VAAPEFWLLLTALSKADKQEISPPRFLDTAESALLVRPEQPVSLASVVLRMVLL
jgi:hypothetical protein